jgi:hypothetical protein
MLHFVYETVLVKLCIESDKFHYIEKMTWQSW